MRVMRQFECHVTTKDYLDKLGNVAEAGNAKKGTVNHGAWPSQPLLRFP